MTLRFLYLSVPSITFIFSMNPTNFKTKFAYLPFIPSKCMLSLRYSPLSFQELKIHVIDRSNVNINIELWISQCNYFSLLLPFSLFSFFSSMNIIIGLTSYHSTMFSLSLCPIYYFNFLYESYQIQNQIHIYLFFFLLMLSFVFL